ncbi:MAG TPA: hypothetical protein VEX63_13165, partial [Flavisolibacter sp.]|nr:hypothetical protein [Flavisolibacter sp.]
KVCSARSSEQSYEKHKVVRIHNNETYREALKQKLAEFLNNSLCMDCWEPDIRVLEFDHVRGTKTMDISAMLSRGYSWLMIQKEIEKCDVVCANCHRKRTYDRKPSYRSLFTEELG